MNIKIGDTIKFKQDNKCLVGTVTERFYAGYDETLRLRVSCKRSNNHDNHNIDISIDDIVEKTGYCHIYYRKESL